MGVAETATAARFIVLEGIDGAGTTTHTRLLVKWLETRGRRPHATREPSDGPAGRLLREILRGAHTPVSGTTMALLFAADRMDHLAREILPALERGHDVVSDRYYHSSFAYQSEEADREFVEQVNARARRPDLTFLLRVPAELAEARRRNAGRSSERYDALAIQRRVAANYDELAGRLSAREAIVTVDSSRAIEEVQSDLRREVEKLIRP